MPIEFKGIHLDILKDTTPEQDIEGSLACGKTTVALWRELEALRTYPGIWILMCRWTDDATKTLLRPAFEQLARIHGTSHTWNREENAYAFENGSRAFAFGLKTQSQKPEERYGKIRGLPVSRIYVDQAEQLPEDIASELRARLRPDIEARLKGIAFPTMLTFTPNPVNDDHWLAKQFPIGNKVKGRKYYHLALYDNAHNLPPEMIAGLETAYPIEHPKHQTVILGLRGLNVIGDSIYEGLFKRNIHVRPLLMREGEHAPFLEGYAVGKHNPCWILAQRSAMGGIHLLGGVLAKGFALEDFVPLVDRYRCEWLAGRLSREVLTCSAPIGEAIGGRYTLLRLLRSQGMTVRTRDGGNGPEVQLAMIEYLSGLLRRRLADGDEAVGIEANPKRWIQITKDGESEKPFLAFAFEGGYTWSDHFVSVAHKELRQPNEDDEYANAMACVEQMLLNFCADMATPSERRARQLAQQKRVGSLKIAEGDMVWGER